MNPSWQPTPDGTEPVDRAGDDKNSYGPNVVLGKPIARLTVEYVARRRDTGRITTSTATAERLVLAGFADAISCRAPNRLTRTHVEQWLTTISHLAPGTRRNRFSIVRRFCRWLHTERYCPRDACEGIDAPRVPRAMHRALTIDQVRALLAVCPDARARCIVTLGVQLGLRRAEVAGLELGDIDWVSRVVFVTGKGGHQRFVPLTDEAAAAVRAYLADRPANAGPLIRGDRRPGEHVKPVWIGRLVTRLCYDAGIKERPRDGVSFHAARHTAATDVYRACRDVLAVRDLLGHVSLATTQVYVRGLDLEPLRLAVEGRHYAA